MSTGKPIPRDLATKIIAHLRAKLGLYALGPGDDDAPLAVMPVGSYRRGLPTVGDIELIAPMPKEGDPLHDRLAAHFYDPTAKPETTRTTQLALFGGAPAEEIAALAGPPRGERFGNPGPGLRPRFGYAQVELFLKLPQPNPPYIKLDWFRFDAGPNGNRGWVQLIRTGPWDFSRDCCARWKRITNGGYSTSGDDLGGCLYRAGGTRVPVPDEATAFELLELPYIEPRERRSGTA